VKQILETPGVSREHQQISDLGFGRFAGDNSYPGRILQSLQGLLIVFRDLIKWGSEKKDLKLITPSACSMI
jgi:hypothetical protein